MSDPYNIISTKNKNYPTHNYHKSQTCDPDGRILAFSLSQEAHFLIHDRILKSSNEFVSRADEEGFEVVMGGKERVAMRLVVSRMHVGCLLGKEGREEREREINKII